MSRKLVRLLVLLVSVAAIQPAQAGPPHFEGFEDPGSAINTVPNWNNYNSVLTRVPSGTGGIASKSGIFHANLDSTLLPAPPDDYTGAFTRLGGYSSVFPASGFKAALDVYMDLNDPAVLNNTSQGGVSRLVADLSRARQLLDYQPRTQLREGLKQLLAKDPQFGQQRAAA